MTNHTVTPCGHPKALQFCLLQCPEPEPDLLPPCCPLPLPTVSSQPGRGLEWTPGPPAPAPPSFFRTAIMSSGNLMMIVRRPLAASQRKLSLPSSTCPSISERPPHPEHTELGHRRQRGRASRRPLVRAGPAFLGAPRLFTCPQRPRCPGTALTLHPRRQAQCPARERRRSGLLKGELICPRAGENPDPFTALQPWSQPAAGRRLPPWTSGRLRRPASSSLRGPPTTDENRV